MSKNPDFESKHPRRDGGKFAEKPEVSAGVSLSETPSGATVSDHDRHRLAEDRAFMSDNPDELRKIAHYAGRDDDANVQIWKRLLDNPQTPDDAVANLPHSPNSYLRSRYAERRSADPEALRLLSDDPHREVRASVAGNTRTPPKSLKSLTHDPDTLVRSELAYNEATPTEALDTLANDQNWAIRRQVAWNPSASQETVDRLREDSDHMVRYAVESRARTLANRARSR